MSQRQVASMPNNRLLAKEEVATYSGMLLDAALEQGGAERVLEVREQLDFVLRTYRGNADSARGAWQSGVLP